MKKILAIVLLIAFLSTPLTAQERRKDNYRFYEIKRSGTLFAGVLLDEGVDGLTAGIGYFQEYKNNLHIGATLSYTVGEFVFFGGSDIDYFKLTPSVRQYRLLPPIGEYNFFLQGGISYNDIKFDNGESKYETGFNFGLGWFTKNKEYLLMYNYINMDGEDRKYLTFTLGYFFF